jgi:diguanylate cyclase (GGDEF)-like protein
MSAPGPPDGVPLPGALTGPAERVLRELLLQQAAAFVERLPFVLSTLLERATALDGAAHEAAIEDIVHRLHKLAGSGGMVGHTELGQAARELERHCMAWRDAPPAPDETRELQRALTEFCRQDWLSRADASRPSPSSQPAPASADAPPAPSGFWLFARQGFDDTELARSLSGFGFGLQRFNDAEALPGELAKRPPLALLLVLDQADEPVLTALQGSAVPVITLAKRDNFALRMASARLGALMFLAPSWDLPKLAQRMVRLQRPRPRPPERVLLVDDDQTLTAYMAAVLQAAGMQVQVLDNAENLLPALAAQAPELVLMDLNMPRFRGTELVSLLRQHQRWAGLPVVFLSGETDLERQVEALDHGADDFLTKPISDARLVSLVRSRVGRARRLDALIHRDGLTGLLKHASFKDSLDVLLGQCREQGLACTVAMVDIDHFKSVNDQHGHATGDMVIAALATLLRQRLRKDDLIGRYGGEEFAVALPDCGLQQAWRLMDELRERFAGLSFQTGHPTPLACALSVGLAQSQGRSQGVELLQRADAALYQAKRLGRNQVQPPIAQA